MRKSGLSRAARVQPEPALTRSDAMWLLVAIGTASGGLRAVGLAVANLQLGRYVQQGVNLLWTAPLGTTILVLVWGALVWLAGTIAPTLRRPSAFIAASIWLPATSIVLDISSVHPAAAAVFAAGMASVVMRIVRRIPATAIAIGRRVAVVGIVGTMLAFIGLVIAMPQVEAWKNARLPAPPAGAPNVLLIVLDTVRAKSLGAYGNDRGTSPFLDALGNSGVRFAQAYAPAPWTAPTHASIMTGLWPDELGVDWDHRLDGRKPTVAEVLRNAGYLTAGFVANMGNTGINSGLARGFTHFEDYPISAWNVVCGSNIGDQIVGSAWLRNLMGVLSKPDRKRSPEVSAEFLGWLDRQPSRPFFAFLNYFDAHNPYEAPAEVEMRFGVPAATREASSIPLDWMEWDDTKIEAALRTYEAAIAYQDDQLRRLFAELDRRGTLSNTLVIVTSDHGEEFGEHGVMRHGNSLYRASVHVPLVVSFPSQLPGGRVISTPVSLRSVTATLADAVPGLERGPFRGPSLFDIMADATLAEPVLSTVSAVPAQPVSFPVHNGPLYSLLHGGYRYIVNALGVEQLYLLSDEAEKTNLAAHPARHESLIQLRATLAKLRGTNR